jgi:hypothetical protein
MARPPRRPPPAPAIERISEPSSDLTALPARVAAMRDKILEAVAAGDIEALRPAIEWNEMPPIFSRGTKPAGFARAIDVLKRRSFDGEGREILAILGAVFAQPYVRTTRGPAETYVWPAFAVRQAPDPSPEERLAMYRCVRFENIALHNDIGLPLIERAGIGADGTWHYFWSG